MRKLIKKILNESSELDWIKNVKSNQDIAQEIADESEIKKDRLYTPFSCFFLSSSPPFFPPHLITSSHLFTEYCKEQYGLSKGDIDDVWERYKDIIKDEVNNI